MAKCSYCGSTILMGGTQAGNNRFCNKKCLQNAYIEQASQQIPVEVLDRQVNEIWNGACPKCNGPGPVEIHKYHEVWSALVLTRWTSMQQVSCRFCASKRQAGSILFSLVLGWWGFPWGLILTPVQITRNTVGIFQKRNPAAPSAELRRLIRVNIGARLLASQRQGAAVPPPLPKA